MKNVLEKLRPDRSPYPGLSPVAERVEGRVDVDVITRRLHLAVVLDSGQRATVVEIEVGINPFTATGAERGWVRRDVRQPAIHSLDEERALARAHFVAGIWTAQFENCRLVEV